MTDKFLENPFSVQTPESLSASETVKLFVDVFTDFFSVNSSGHTFINGPRGSGKSMMLRFMMPDCQVEHLGCGIKDLPFFAIYLPTKQTILSMKEWDLLEGVGTPFFNEHLLVVTLCGKLFKTLLDAVPNNSSESMVEEMIKLYETAIRQLLTYSFFEGEPIDFQGCSDIKSALSRIVLFFDKVYSELAQLAKKTTGSAPYTGPLLGYLDFFVPMVSSLKNLSFFPNAPIYVLIDDADNLSMTQTRVLNSWVASRTTADVSLKISTQLGYKTFETYYDSKIEAPHDYNEVNISTVYTSPRGLYRRRVSEIVAKRLTVARIKATPEEFFPKNIEQERKIEEIAQEYRDKWETEGTGYRPGDDAYRYARPEYIKRLQGTSKQGSTYSYAGFSQLVDISSGIIRYFLEAASLMYAQALAEADGSLVNSIPARIQDKVIDRQADNLIFQNFDRNNFDNLERSETDISDEQRLYNLIKALGGTFREILHSKRSERRVFSFAISDQPVPPDVERIIRLGVRQGYLQESSIGDKEGIGRKKLFILNRRLAPIFKLDPTSFAGYLFLTSRVLRDSMTAPGTLIRTAHRMRDENSDQFALFNIESGTEK